MQRAKPRKSARLPTKQPLQRTAYQALARLLKARADELGLSVRELAARVRQPRTTVHKTLSGQRRLDPIEFVDWCEALELGEPTAVIRKLKQR